MSSDTCLIGLITNECLNIYRKFLRLALYHKMKKKHQLR